MTTTDPALWSSLVNVAGSPATVPPPLLATLVEESLQPPPDASKEDALALAMSLAQRRDLPMQSILRIADRFPEQESAALRLHLLRAAAHQVAGLGTAAAAGPPDAGDHAGDHAGDDAGDDAGDRAAHILVMETDAATLLRLAADTRNNPPVLHLLALAAADALACQGRKKPAFRVGLMATLLSNQTLADETGQLLVAAARDAYGDQSPALDATVEGRLAAAAAQWLIEHDEHDALLDPARPGAAALRVGACLVKRPDPACVRSVLLDQVLPALEAEQVDVPAANQLSDVLLAWHAARAVPADLHDRLRLALRRAELQGMGPAVGDRWQYAGDVGADDARQQAGTAGPATALAVLASVQKGRRDLLPELLTLYLSRRDVSTDDAMNAQRLDHHDVVPYLTARAFDAQFVIRQLSQTPGHAARAVAAGVSPALVAAALVERFDNDGGSSRLSVSRPSSGAVDALGDDVGLLPWRVLQECLGSSVVACQWWTDVLTEAAGAPGGLQLLAQMCASMSGPTRDVLHAFRALRTARVD